MEVNIQLILRVVLVFLIAGLVFSIPTLYIEKYAEWVRKKHGRLMLLLVGLQLSLAGAGIVCMLTEPERPRVGMISGVIVLMIGLAIAWDNYTFWRSQYRSK